MTSARLLSELLALPPEERREVALRLLDSLDEPPSPEIEEAQYQEVLRRVRDIDEGKVELIPWQQVREELLGLLAHGER